jgi:hypothetical protein
VIGSRPGSADLDGWGTALPLAAGIRSLGLLTDDFRPYSFTTLSEEADSGSVVALFERISGADTGCGCPLTAVIGTG